MTTLITIPATDFAPGAHGLFTEAISAGCTSYGCTHSRGAWPESGNVLTYEFSISEDGGKTWRFDCSLTFAGGPWYEMDGVTKRNTAETRIAIPAAKPSTLLRCNLTVHQACQIGHVFEAA